MAEYESKNGIVYRGDKPVHDFNGKPGDPVPKAIEYAAWCNRQHEEAFTKEEETLP